MNKLKIMLSIAIFFVSYILASINQTQYFPEISPQSYGQLCMYELKDQEIFSKLYCKNGIFDTIHSMLFSSFVSLLYYLFKPNLIIQGIIATTLYALTITILFLISNKFLKWYQALILTLILILNKFTLYHLSIPDKEPLSNFLLALTFYALTYILYKPNTKDIIMFALIINAVAESSATYTIITPLFIIVPLLNSNNKKIRIKQLIILFFIFLIFAIPKAKLMSYSSPWPRDSNKIREFITQLTELYKLYILNNSYFLKLILIITSFIYVMFAFTTIYFLIKNKKTINKNKKNKKLIHLKNIKDIIKIEIKATYSLIFIIIIGTMIVLTNHAGRKIINPHVLSRLALPTYLFIIFNLSALTIYSKTNKKMTLKIHRNKKINPIPLIINVLLILTLIENTIYAYQNEVFKTKENIFISTQFALNDLAKFFNKHKDLLKDSQIYIIGNEIDDLWISKIYYMPIDEKYKYKIKLVATIINRIVNNKKEYINKILKKIKRCNNSIIIVRNPDYFIFKKLLINWSMKNIMKQKLTGIDSKFLRDFIISLYECNNNKIIKLYENQKYVIFLIPKKNETESKH